MVEKLQEWLIKIDNVCKDAKAKSENVNKFLNTIQLLIIIENKHIKALETELLNTKDRKVCRILMGQIRDRKYPEELIVSMKNSFLKKYYFINQP